MKEFAGKRVLMLLENNPFERDWRPLREARTLVAAGYRVAVISPRIAQGAWVIHNGAVTSYHFPAPPEPRNALGYIWEYLYATCAMFLLSLVVWVREGFDIVHAHNPPDTLWIIGGFYRLLGKRFVFDHHDLAPEMYIARYGKKGQQSLYRMLVFLERQTCRLAHRVIATNDSYRALEIERDGIPPEMVTVVRNGPDLIQTHPVEPDSELRQKAGTILGYVGQMGPQDGLDELIKILQLLVYELHREDVLCVIIGKGDMVPRLKTLADELQLRDHVWFTGFIPHADMLKYLSTADICVDPDPSNPFTDRSTMVKLMEYMALGKAIVAFDLPEHRVTAGDAAVYARANDRMDFARKLADLMDDPDRRAELGKRGYARVESSLTWEHQAKHLLDAYSALGGENLLGAAPVETTEPQVETIGGAVSVSTALALTEPRPGKVGKPFQRAQFSSLGYALEEIKFVRSPQDLKYLWDDIFYLLPRTVGALDRNLKVPPSLQIEPTNYCNLRCVCCPVWKSTRAQGFMELGLYERIVDDAARSGVRRVRLFLHGEPLLHPRFAEMVKLAKMRGLAVHITTNGMPLNDKNRREILRAGVTRADHLTVSVLGASKPVIETVMVRVNYDRVVENIMQFLELRRELGMNGPVVETIMYSMPQNELEVEQFVRFWQGKVDHVRLGGQISASFADYGKTPAPHMLRQRTCSNLWERMTVFWNGDVTLCCQDVDGHWILGNLESQSIRQVWNSDLLNNVRQIHRSGQFSSFPFCCECDM